MCTAETSRGFIKPKPPRWVGRAGSLRTKSPGGFWPVIAGMNVELMDVSSD